LAVLYKQQIHELYLASYWKNNYSCCGRLSGNEQIAAAAAAVAVAFNYVVG